MKLPASHISLLALVILISGVLYHEIFFIPPVADDLWHISNARHYGLNIFFKGDPFVRLWERLLIAINYSIYADQHYILSAVSFFGFLLGIVLVFVLARRWWSEQPALPLVAAILFAFHSVNVGSVYQIDTIAQLANAVMILVCLLWFTSRAAMTGRHYHLIGVLLAAATLLTKETSIGVVFALPLVAAALRRFVYQDETRDVWRGLLIGLGGILVVFALYMVLRAYLGASVGETVEGTRYDLTFSPLVLAKNVAMLMGSVVYFGSTVEIMVSPNTTRLALSAVITVVMLLLVALGFWAALRGLSEERDGNWTEGSRRELVYAGVAAFMLASCHFPAMLIPRVSEQYALLLTPFYSLVGGYFACRGFQWLGERLRLAPATRALLATALLAIYSGWMSFGIVEKLNLAETAGLRSQDFLKQITAWHAELPDEAGPVVVCYTGDTKRMITGRKRYSVFGQDNGHLVKSTWRAFRLIPRPIEVTTPDDPNCAYRIEVADNHLTFPAASSSQ